MQADDRVSSRQVAGLDPRLISAILLGQYEEGEETKSFHCGCAMARARIWICSYHEGYEDALAIHASPYENFANEEALLSAAITYARQILAREVTDAAFRVFTDTDGDKSIAVHEHYEGMQLAAQIVRGEQ